jgi:hypothetical protein
MQKFGILKNLECRGIFEKINKRELCKECHEKRAKFESRDKKHNSCYSNLIPGFSSSEIKPPVDILIVAEAHGGGRQDSFRKQGKLDDEVNYISDYYLNDPLSTYHQQQMRELFNELDNLNKSWVFTDLIKCFVWRGKGNVEKAIESCKNYLDWQITVLAPKKILALGQKVATKYFALPLKILTHGEIYKDSIVWSYFPSRNTADIWVENGGWRNIINKL